MTTKVITIDPNKFWAGVKAKENLKKGKDPGHYKEHIKEKEPKSFTYLGKMPNFGIHARLDAFINEKIYPYNSSHSSREELYRIFNNSLAYQKEFLDLEQIRIDKSIEALKEDSFMQAKTEEVESLFCDLEQKCQDEFNISSMEITPDPEFRKFGVIGFSLKGTEKAVEDEAIEVLFGDKTKTPDYFNSHKEEEKEEVIESKPKLSFSQKLKTYIKNLF